MAGRGVEREGWDRRAALAATAGAKRAGGRKFSCGAQAPARDTSKRWWFFGNVAPATRESNAKGCTDDRYDRGDARETPQPQAHCNWQVRYNTERLTRFPKLPAKATIRSRRDSTKRYKTP